MDFDIEEIRDYYDAELQAYDYIEIVSLGISHNNADFMISIGVPAEIKNEVAMKMRQQGEYTSYKYACELRRLFEQIDPAPMKDAESYWSHLVEDYETGL